jgi:DNA-binding transcriptional ArsR family regulator
MKDLEKSLKGLANQRRLRIVQYLKKNKEASVGNIAKAIKLSFRSTSRHLAVLAAADIVEKEQRGLLVFYSLSPSSASVIKFIIEYV